MHYHSDRFSVFFGNKLNGLEAHSKRQSSSEEEVCSNRLSNIISQNSGKIVQAPVILLQQVHGLKIYTLNSYDNCVAMALRSCEGDGLITTLPHTAVGVLTADCLPVILYNREMHQLAVVHAGWRGIVQGIIRRAIEQLGLHGQNATVVFGPSARACCYEVGQDFLDYIPATHRYSVQRRDNHFYFDLPTYAQQELALLGISASLTPVEPPCTICNAHFYSYRREGPDCMRRQATVAILHD